MSKKNKAKKKKEKEVEASANVPINEDSIEAKPRRQASKAKKSPARTSVKRAGAKTDAAALLTSPGDPTDEQIGIRAYFIAERRHRLALPGNTDSDWLEAKRQLLSEIDRADRGSVTQAG